MKYYTKKRVIYIMACIASIIAPLTLAASERAQFWNLGFSQNSQYFAFSQYWVDSKNSHASSEMYIIDTAHNTFVPGGSSSYRSNSVLSPGNDGRNASLHLFRQQVSLFNRYKIDNVTQGRLVYIRVNGTTDDSSVRFRDFATTNTYSIDVVQRRGTDGAAFSLAVDVTRANGRTQTLNVGLPNYYRKDVYSYRLSQVIVAPDERTLIFVIEQEFGFENSNRVRYMVESAVLN